VKQRDVARTSTAIDLPARSRFAPGWWTQRSTKALMPHRSRNNRDRSGRTKYKLLLIAANQPVGYPTLSRNAGMRILVEVHETPRWRQLS